ncbi:MAG TPA: Clp protease N-terminal domain-containing protein [Candidatus Limnocylindria bacterium]|nr:Clp protease N-terminal domain-containing protein [Candidatus Limnocylindria bacterium]
MGPFDRFNDRAKRVLALAQDEAIRFNHNYIGVEHLLLGLVREGEGVAARALASLGVDLSKLRSTVERIVGRGDSTTTPTEITLSPRTKRIIDLAIDESRKLGHGAVATEHLLLGIVREGEGIASGVLQSLGVELDRVRRQVIATLGQQPPGMIQLGEPMVRVNTYTARYQSGRETLTDATRRVVALAQNEAIGLGHTWLGTEHLVLGLLSANRTPAQDALRSLGLTLEATRERVSTLPPPPAEWRTSDLAMSPLTMRLLEGWLPGQHSITPESLLNRIVKESDSQGAQLLSALGATKEKVQEAIGNATGKDPPPSC